MPGSADAILETLATFGFEWSGDIVRQSTRAHVYERALTELLTHGHAFECSCTRSEIEAAQPPSDAPGDEHRYPGWCRLGVRHPQRSRAVRLRVESAPVAFDDAIQQHVSVDVAADAGDFVIRRRDGLYAYQLACAVDDAAQGVTHVVRGADLIASTPRQILVQRALGLPTPEYAHLPVATDGNGGKLSKSAGAAAIDGTRPVDELWRALRFLRQSPPPRLRHSGLTALWDWAIEHWRTAPLHGLRHASIDEDP